MSSSLESPLRILSVDLGALDASPSHWSGAAPGLERLASWGGSATCAALFLEAARRGELDAPRIAIAVGAAVRAGLPTAARAAVGGRSPLSGRYVEGALGSDLARRLASVADALVLHGRAREPGAVLVLDAGPRLSLESVPELIGLAPAECARRLRERFGPCASVCIGPAGEAGIPFATLASGAEPPSFVGRGGLGAQWGALGLKALVVRAAPVPDAPDEIARALTALCSRSPRLRARSQEGTLEMAAAFAARHEPRAPHWSPGEIEPRRERKGCAGCPTPCGFVFERGAGPQGAHFSALQPLGRGLGLERLEDALLLLERCDAAGIDAKEAGAVLELLDRARARGLVPGARLAGDLAALQGALDDLVARRGVGALLSRGAAEVARELGLAHEADVVHGQAVRAEQSEASRLGVYASARGGDPMRTLSFLAGDVPARASLERLCAPAEVPLGAEDPRDPRGKGFVVWWGENLSNGLDASGFCAFSAAALLSDGVATLDELAGELIPVSQRAGLDAGRALLVRGASIALAQHELAHTLGRTGSTAPAWLRPVLEHEEGWPAYARLRGLELDGRVRPEAWSALGTEALLDLAPPARSRAVPERSAAPVETASGTCRVRSSGALARALGAERGVTLHLPASLTELVRALAREQPHAARWLVQEGRIVPVAYRGGRRLDAADLVRAGDELDLVVALSGG